MPTFSERDFGRLDYSILQNGAVVLYHSTDLLARDSDVLRSEGYGLVEIDCSLFSGCHQFANAVGKALGFWDQWNGNLDALNDFLRDIPFPTSDCLAVVLHHFDSLHSRDSKFTGIVTDIFASNARLHLLFGKRLILILQSDNPRFNLQPVGASPVCWNRKELLDESRIGEKQF